MGLFTSKQLINAYEILRSELHDEHSFYDRLIDDMYECQKSIYIESPFIKSARCQSLLPYFEQYIKVGIAVTVVTRHPRTYDEASTQEVAAEIVSLKSIGVKIKFSGPKAHRKLVILDDHVLYEGSLNVLSHFNSEEIMRRLASPTLVKEMRRYLKI